MSIGSVGTTPINLFDLEDPVDMTPELQKEIIELFTDLTEDIMED